MQKSVAFLLGLLIVIGCGTYSYGIIQACIMSWNPPPYNKQVGAFLFDTVTSIGAVFATNLGAVLGISVSIPNSQFSNPKVWNPLTFFNEPSISHLQIFACYIYLISLFSAGFVWGHRNFEPDSTKILPLIPELTKSLIGVIVGVLAVTLNVPKTK